MLGDQNHCGRTNCRCTHNMGCERGFIWTEWIERHEKRVKDEIVVTRQSREGVRFCPVCDPERAHIQKTSNSPQELQERLQARSKYKASENYERTESEKTRTL